MSVQGEIHNYWVQRRFPTLVLAPFLSEPVSSGRAWWVSQGVYVRPACLAWVSRRGGPLWPCDASSALGGSAGPGEVDGWVRQTSLRLPLRSSFPGYPESPVVLPTVGLPRTSLTVFEACGLSVFYHICGLDRFSFGCGIHAAPNWARAACSKLHSLDQVVPFFRELFSFPHYFVL